MEKEKIEYLALEATKAYMSGKTMASRDSFLKEFMETYDNALKTLNDRETKKWKVNLAPLDGEEEFSTSKQR